MKDERTFEERLERLKKIVSSLERGSLPLEDGVALFKEGKILAEECAGQLSLARNEVKIVADGLIQDFDAKNENGDISNDS